MAWHSKRGANPESDVFPPSKVFSSRLGVSARQSLLFSELKQVLFSFSGQRVIFIKNSNGLMLYASTET